MSDDDFHIEDGEELYDAVDRFLDKHYGRKQVFDPWGASQCTRDKDGKTITGTIALKPGYRLISVDVLEETFMVARFEVDEFHCEICGSDGHDSIGHGP